MADETNGAAAAAPEAAAATPEVEAAAGPELSINVICQSRISQRRKTSAVI